MNFKPHSKLRTAMLAGALSSTLLGVLGHLVTAQPAPAKATVTPSLQAFKVAHQGDKESFAPAQNVRPGDVIEYRAAYSNGGRSTVRNLAATLPIPVGTAFVSGSALPGNAQASLDGRSFAAMPLTRTVKTAQGNKTVPVPPREYRALRWNVAALDAGQTVRMTARVRVLRSGE